MNIYSIGLTMQTVDVHVSRRHGMSIWPLQCLVPKIQIERLGTFTAPSGFRNHRPHGMFPNLVMDGEQIPVPAGNPFAIVSSTYARHVGKSTLKILLSYI